MRVWCLRYVNHKGLTRPASDCFDNIERDSLQQIVEIAYDPKTMSFAIWDLRVSLLIDSIHLMTSFLERGLKLLVGCFHAKR
jgi:hypothetical protein